MMSNVAVALRIRPLVNSEISRGCKDVLEVFPELSQVRIKNTDKAFTYNYIFDSRSTQTTVYEESVQHMIQNLFDGYNLTILAYGQTGSGKTHSMGTAYNGEEDMGIIPRAVSAIFQKICDNFSHEYTVSVSFMELYQDVLYDLLSDKSRDQCVLDIREDPNKGIIIPSLTEVQVHNAEGVLDALKTGSKRRATGSTNMNAQSSSSHAIFTINLSMSNTSTCDAKTAKLHFVDLAGSEKQKKTGAVGNTFKEGGAINNDLLVLGNVISALGDEKNHNHIPYRDSNLTRLLRDSLGGNSITLMIACVSPADPNLEESLSTLRYADRARKIQNKPIVNEDPKASEINRLKKKIQELQIQIVGQGGEIGDLKQANDQLHSKNRELTLNLSSVLNTITGLSEMNVILQNSNDNLHKKIEDLKNDYNITLENISLSFDENDREAIQLNLAKLQQIREQFSEIENDQRNVEEEILNHEQNIRANGSFQDETNISPRQERFTNQQVALNNRLQEVTESLAFKQLCKQHLVRRIATNTQYWVDLAENEAKKLHLQKEKDELLQKLKSPSSHGSESRLSKKIKKQVQDLDAQMNELNKKVHEQAQLMKQKEKEEVQINKLNQEIVQMKQTKVHLIEKMREASERFRSSNMATV